MNKETFIKKLDAYFNENESNKLLAQTIRDVAKYFEEINTLIKNPAEQLEIIFDYARAKRIEIRVIDQYIRAERFQKKIVFVFGIDDYFGLKGARGQVGAPELTFSLENGKLVKDSDKTEFSIDFLDEILENLLPKE